MMKAATLSRNQSFSIDTLALHEPGQGEARVRIEACGICGSDLHLLHANLMAPGHTPGHEMAGVVDAVGSNVSHVALGDRVAVEPLASCGQCEECLGGRDSICRSLELYGIHRRGGLAQQIVVQEDRLYALAADLDPAVAAMTEPMAVALHGLDRGGFSSGQQVLIMGAGAVGLVTLVAARSLGASQVYITARHAHQAEMARNLGATRVINEKDADLTKMDELGRQVDLDLVVETVGGSANTLEAACVAARPGGTISVLGLFMTSPRIAPMSLLLKELNLAWSNCYHRPLGLRPDFERAAKIVSEERDRLDLLVTHRVSLEDVNDGFRLASDKSAGAIKVSVLPTH